MPETTTVAEEITRRQTEAREAASRHLFRGFTDGCKCPNQGACQVARGRLDGKVAAYGEVLKLLGA